MQNHAVLGIGLVFLGAMLLAGQFGLVGDHMTLYIIAGGFLLFYKYVGGAKHYRNIGFLIPGLIILAIAVFAGIEQWAERWVLGGGWFFLLIGAAFLGVYLIHTRVCGEDAASRRWPLYPASGLGAFALFVGLVENVEDWRRLAYLNYVWPVGLILAGLYFLFRSVKTGR